MALALTIGASVLGAVGAITGAVMGSVSAATQANQARANAEAAQAQAEYNKRQEMREASATEAEAAENARRQRVEAERLKSQQIAALGKSGAAMSSGSPLAVLGQTAMDQELAVADTHYNGYRAASAHRQQATMYEYQGRVAEAQGNNAYKSGMLNALNLSGYANAASKTMQAGVTLGKYLTGSSTGE